MNDLYAATPPAGRDALLTEMLKDAVSEVRLAGVRLLQTRLTTGQPLGEALSAQLRARVTDAVDDVRRAAALLLPTAAAAQAPRRKAAGEESVPDTGYLLPARGTGAVFEAVFQHAKAQA